MTGSVHRKPSSSTRWPTMGRVRAPITLLPLTLLAFWALGCGGPQTAKPTGGQPAGAASRATAPEDTSLARVREGSVELYSTAQLVPTQCKPGQVEACTGLDDDCDGKIDEGCGYASGAMQVTLSWQGSADLDLYVLEPSGETVHHTNPRSGSGARLDHEGRGGCRANAAHPAIENVYWAADPQPGRYEVTLHYWGECNSAAGSLDATLSVSVGGKVFQTYRVNLVPGDRLMLVAFEMASIR